MKLHEIPIKTDLFQVWYPYSKGTCRIHCHRSQANCRGNWAVGWSLNPRCWLEEGVRPAVSASPKTAKEAEDLATQILGMEIKGLSVRKVLVDEAANIVQEIYLGITNDRSAQRPVIMGSAAGGVGD